MIDLKQLALNLHKKHNQSPFVAKTIAAVTQSIALPIATLCCLIPQRIYGFPLSQWSLDKADKIKTKYDKYLSFIKTHQDSSGFIETEECDSTLFSGLVSSAGASVNMLAARNTDKAWLRRPTSYEACWYEGKGKSSTISRDMLMGVLWHCWAKRDIKTAEELFAYGMENNWVMGKGDFSRIIFTPSLQATLAEIIYRLGGKNHVIYRNMPRSWPTGLVGYEMHLQMLHIELLGQMFNGLTKKMRTAICDNLKREPHNPFAQYLQASYIDGNFSIVLDSLLNEDLWPADRLPSNKDRKASWLFQQPFYKNGSLNSAWLPSSADEVSHTGGDFLFLAKLFLDKSDLID